MDYLTDLEGGPQFVGAFGQTNAGDMSPNLNLRPGSGPTEDEFENTRIIGSRQYDAAAALASSSGVALGGPVAGRTVYIDMARVTVEPAFTGDGCSHATSGPAGGSAAFAGAGADGPAYPGFREGRNPWWDWPSTLVYRWRPDCAIPRRRRGSCCPARGSTRCCPWWPSGHPCSSCGSARSS